MATILILIDYKWGIFLRTFNFFTDGRIKTFFKKKILNVHDPTNYQDKSAPKSAFSTENTEKLCDFFNHTDHSLLLGFPRWMLVEALAEEFGLQENDHVFREFYRTTSDNPLKPKGYNFTMNEMFRFLESFEVKMKKPVEGQIDGLIERMRGKIQKAEEANQAWVLKKEQQKNKMFEEMRGLNHGAPVQLNENELKILQIKEEIMGLDNSPQSMERMKALMGQIQVLQNKQNR